MTLDSRTARLSAALPGRYRIERELGQGGMATVYLADDRKHRRQVAVQVLRPELAEALGGERFLAGIATTANLRHPHILPLFWSRARWRRQDAPAILCAWSTCRECRECRWMG